MTEHLEPGDVIAPDAIRLPAGPVPLRWGTTGPVIGWVTLEREDDGTIVVDAASDPLEVPAGMSPLEYLTRWGFTVDAWEPAPTPLAPDVLEIVERYTLGPVPPTTDTPTLPHRVAL